MKKLLLPFCSLLFFSCSTISNFFIPGEFDIINENISIEYFTIAEGYYDLEKYSKAIEYYKLAMKNQDLYYTSFYKIAKSYALLKEWNEALVYYKELLERDSENTSLKLSVSYITAMSGKTDEAIAQYEELLVENPNDQFILENYIALLIFAERGEDAEKNLLELKKKFPDSKEIKEFAARIAELVENPDPDLGEVEDEDFEDDRETEAR